MSRQASLPPRCPFQKKPLSQPTDGSASRPESITGNSLYRRHQRSSSQSFVPEEQPAWYNDLLSDPDWKPEGCLRRSASDSATFLENVLKQPLSNDDGQNHIGNYGTFCRLDSSACVYGPNSPRQRDNSPFSKNAIVSAFSNYATEDPLPTNQDRNANSAVMNSNLIGICISSGELNPDIKPVKRHPSQRSRVRKLQYIAQLEQTVNMLQNLESDLAARATAMLQQHTTLSIENSKLRQQLIRQQQLKLIMEDEYGSLKKEAERLKIGLANSGKNVVRRHVGLNPAIDATGSHAPWHVPDIGKLSLN